MLNLQADDNIAIQIALIDEFPTGVMGFGEHPTDVGIEEATGSGVGIVYGIIRVAVTQGVEAQAGIIIYAGTCTDR